MCEYVMKQVIHTTHVRIRNEASYTHHTCANTCLSSLRFLRKEIMVKRMKPAQNEWLYTLHMCEYVMKQVIYTHTTHVQIPVSTHCAFSPPDRLGLLAIKPRLWLWCMYECVFVCMYECMFVYTCICRPACNKASPLALVSACMHVCLYVRIYVYLSQ